MIDKILCAFFVMMSSALFGISFKYAFETLGFFYLCMGCGALAIALIFFGGN